MIDIRTKKCIEENCNVTPTFNFPNIKKAIYCSLHKKEHMVSLYNKKCIHPDCNIMASYNFPGIKERIYCTKHKKEYMISYYTKICEYESCNTTAKYNFKEEKIPIFCTKHKEENMIHLSAKRCQKEGCETIPTFNFLGLKPIYCSAHKEYNMINLVDKLCEHESCSTIATFNFITEKNPIYCKAHKKEFMMNVVDPKCKTPNCHTIVQNKYRGYCFYCFIHTFPEEKIAKNYLTKEKAVSNFVQNNFPSYNWIFNKTILNGTSLRRPDIYLELENRVLIVEVDENQHQSYDCSCENKRLVQIFQDTKFKPLIFIRFNPDKYYNTTNKLVESPWKVQKDGFVKITENEEVNWVHRLNMLKDSLT